MVDPSELLRPELAFADKEISKFRDYSVDETDPLKEMVRRTYRQMHLNQTVDFVKGITKRVWSCELYFVEICTNNLLYWSDNHKIIYNIISQFLLVSVLFLLHTSYNVYSYNV